ncbi:hypothetical protein TWF718_005719 [Orbilia javanica]|uniref:Uncharacterized protein n=1 Tax=Orbilia javanica TaxID=47235 RepID=A0AAN8MSC3_9PEZI
MSFRSAWTNLTSYAQPLKSSLQGITRGVQPRALTPSNLRRVLHLNASSAGAIESSSSHDGTTEGHQTSPRMGISNELLRTTRDLRNDNLKQKGHLNDLGPSTQTGNKVLGELDHDGAKVEFEHGSLDQNTDADQIDASTAATKKKKRKKKKQDQKENKLEQESKAIGQAKPSAAAALIDNLLDSISDPRVGSLGLPPPEPKKQKSKVTIDALLESIPVSKASPSKPLSGGPPGRRGGNREVPVAYKESEYSNNEPYVNITKASSEWKNKSLSRAYHILRLDNCGPTMIKSDIDRIFSNYHARRLDWNFTVVPARHNLRLQRRNRYYLYFDSDEAAKHHLAHFSELLQSEKQDGRSRNITFPPPAAAQTFLESKPAGLDLDSEALQGSAISVSRHWVPNLVLVNPLKMPLDGVIPSLLYRAGGAPDRTVLISLCASSHWTVLQKWLRHSLIESHGFGKWLVTGGDKEGCGLERIPIVGPNTPEPSQGGRWVVRFRDGYTSEAERLVRDWDGQWVNVQGKWGRLRAEVLW